MAKVVGDIAIDVTADIGPLIKEMSRAGTATRKFGRVSDKVAGKLKDFGNRTQNLGKKLSIVSGAMAAAGAAAFALAKGTADAGDKIAKTSRGAGVSAQYYQEMAYAIGQVSDVSEDELASSLQRLTKSIGEGAKGTKAQVEALEELGFTQSQIASGSITTQQAFDAYITKMDGMKDPALAAAISNDLLGRSGVRLGAQLAGAGGSVAALRDRANELGIILSKDALNSSEKFGDQMDDLKRSFEAVKLKLGAELLPLFTEKLIPIIQEKVVPALINFGDKIGDIIQWFGNLPGPVQEAIGMIAAGFAIGGPILVGIGLVSTALGALVAATGPVGLFIAAATLAYAAWRKWGEDIKTAVGGAINWLQEKFEGFIEYMRGLPEALMQVGRDMIQGLINGINEKWEELKAKVFEMANALPTWMKDLLGIHSPSRVFMEIGGHIGDGLAQGIAESSAMVEQAVASLGNAAIKGSQNTAHGVLANMQTMFQGSKKLSAGIALANSWLAFTEVLKDPSFVGRPFARIAAAGAALSSGLNAVKNIKSATPGGSSSGASASSAAPQQAPLQVRLSTFGDGNKVNLGDLGDLLTNLNEVAGDRGYTILSRA